MYIPDPTEIMDNAAENWAFDNVRGNKFLCSCGEWFDLYDGEMISSNPYSLPYCPECACKINRENIERKNRRKIDNGDK